MLSNAGIAATFPCHVWHLSTAVTCNLINKMAIHYIVFFNFPSLLSFSSLSSFVSLPSPLLSLRLELTERQLLLTRTALDNALKDLNQMKYISLCLSSFTLLLLIPLFLCLLVFFFFHCFTFLLLFFFYLLFLFSFFILEKQ